MRLETFTRGVLSGHKVAEVPLYDTQVLHFYVEQHLSVWNVVPRDRIQSRGIAFSWVVPSVLISCDVTQILD